MLLPYRQREGRQCFFQTLYREIAAAVPPRTDISSGMEVSATLRVASPQAPSPRQSLPALSAFPTGSAGKVRKKFSENLAHILSLSILYKTKDILCLQTFHIWCHTCGIWSYSTIYCGIF